MDVILLVLIFFSLVANILVLFVVQRPEKSPEIIIRSEKEIRAILENVDRKLDTIAKRFDQRIQTSMEHTGKVVTEVSKEFQKEIAEVKELL